jgi:hypothetical protein
MSMRILKKQKLGFNSQRWTYRPTRKKIIEKFIAGYTSGKILVIGLEEFERVIAPNASLVGTEGDYNFPFWKPLEKGKFGVVYCFDVIEHLLSPLLFLDRLKLYLKEGAIVFLTWPIGRPQFLWTKGHFNEYDIGRAEEMFKMAGYEFRGKKSGIQWKKPWEYLTGIRSILRLFFPLRWGVYKLKPKGDK